MFNIDDQGHIAMSLNPNGSMCLDGGKNRAGQPVYIAPCNNSAAQSWYTATIPGVLKNRTVDGEWMQRSSLGQIQNRANGLCIDIEGARTDLSRGNSVVLYGCQPIYFDPSPSWAIRNKERPWNQVWGAGHVMNNGAAYVFQRNNPPVLAGHVAWAVQLVDGQWLAGAVDGTLGAIVNKGENNHTFKRLFRTEAELREFFLHGDNAHPFQPYDRYMRWGVNGKVNTAAVFSLEAQSGDWGYGVLGNNCMDQTFKILKVYGLNLQSPAETKKTFPVDWFNTILAGTQPFQLRR